MEKRSESDILLKTLKLTFGGKDYEVPVLRMKDAAKWREAFFVRTREVAESMPANVDEASPDVNKVISRGLMNALLRFPEAIPDLVFSYAPSLPKEEILAEAYDQEFTSAFQAIWRIAFQPFLSSLGMALETGRARASSAPSPSPSSAALN